MSDLQFTAKSPEVALTGATPKTILMATLPANHRGKLLGWSVSFDGTSAVTEPAIVELVAPSSSGTFSATGTVTTNGFSETVQSTVGYNASSEPTITDALVLDRLNVHTQSGYRETYGLGQEVKIPGSGRIGIRVTAPDSVNVVGILKIEE